MNILVTDRDLKRELLRERRRCGGDRFDEVWNGVYVMSPLANDDHQRLVTRLASILDRLIEEVGKGDVRAGVNVTDRDVNWKENYRIPDIAVRFRNGIAQIRDTHWFGGPDFMVEIISRGDRSRQKRGFYAAIGVRELLIVDRRPWAIELYRLEEGKLNLVGKSTRDDPRPLVSEVVPLTFRLTDEQGQSRIEVVHHDGEPRWVV